jgi:hypothetical protein
MEAYQKLRAFWAEEKDRPIATRLHDERDVAMLEAMYGIKLPGDFRAYLLNACPTGENPMDDKVTIWWRLDQIKNIPDEYHAPVANSAVGSGAGYLFFADFMLWCGAWAICCDEGENRGRVIVVGSNGDPFVADSFTAFIDRYVTESKNEGGVPSVTFG